MSDDTIVPSNRIDTNIPLYASIGLSEAASNKVYFSVSQDIIPMHKTTGECLAAILEKKGWTDKEKVWAAYNLKTELLVQKGVPRNLLDMLG